MSIISHLREDLRLLFVLKVGFLLLFALNNNKFFIIERISLELSHTDVAILNDLEILRIDLLLFLLLLAFPWNIQMRAKIIWCFTVDHLERIDCALDIFLTAIVDVPDLVTVNMREEFVERIQLFRLDIQLLSFGELAIRMLPTLRHLKLMVVAFITLIIHLIVSIFVLFSSTPIQNVMRKLFVKLNISKFNSRYINGLRYDTLNWTEIYLRKLFFRVYFIPFIVRIAITCPSVVIYLHLFQRACDCSLIIIIKSENR